MPARPQPSEPLQARHLCFDLDAERLGFSTTDELPDTSDLLGQDRALKAIRLSIETGHKDFNAFVLGPTGSGRHSAVGELLEQHARTRGIPDDWVYVNNFDEPHKPLALRLPPGVGLRLKKAMEALVDDLANDIPALFESDDYQNLRRTIEQGFSEEHEKAMTALSERAQAMGTAILRTPMGIAVAAVKDGDVIAPDAFEALSTDEQEKIKSNVNTIQAELETIMKDVPRHEKARRQAVRNLNAEMVEKGVEDSLTEVLGTFGHIPAIVQHLEMVRSDLIENAELFLMRQPAAQAGPFPVATANHFEDPNFHRYLVTLMVSNDPEETTGAPVVIEELPTLANLIGRIEHIQEMGALSTDFTMIKPGALHRANGGYLVLDARRVLSEPFAWDMLKQCLKTETISIISAGERLSLITTTSLEPDPIPLNVRVVLVGERLLYFLLMALDPDFPALFKIQADFSDNIDTTEDAIGDYARLIGAIAKRERIMALTAAAVVSVIREGSRLAEDAERLTLQIGKLSDILREADHWARAADREVIDASDIERAIAEAAHRAGRIRDLTHDAIGRGTLMIDTEGAKTGQINALSVLEIGGHRFGRPSRITARVRMGTGKLVDIEREVELGGPLHSKGVMILAGYLGTHFATDVPMSLWASIVFEQSYGGIDGDSASAAELFALMSALSGCPIDQSFAVTGSVNQLGEIQPIGGVNEKIEGFFDVCSARGLTGRQGVLIPIANVRNLALRRPVIDAVRSGTFRIIPIATIDQGIALLTGVKAGERDETGSHPDGSVNRLVEERLRSFAHQRRKFAAPTDIETGDGKEASA